MHRLFEDIVCHYRLKQSYRRAFVKNGLEAPDCSIRLTRSSPLPLDGVLRRLENGRFEMEFTGGDLGWIGRATRGKFPAYLHWFTNTPADITEMSVCLSDGDLPTDAMFGPSSSTGTMTPLPDPYFFDYCGFRHMRELSLADTRPWSQRADVLRWRGATTGSGRIHFGPSAADDPTVLARLRLAMIARPDPRMDVLFATGDLSWHLGAMRHNGYAGGRIPEADWVNDKFAVDIDGHTNTWSNLIIRLHLGCCVLKVDSQHGYRQWYYDRIRPWEHFVPVKSDMSDLAEKLDWARSHLPEAEAIARNGQQFARSMTLETETAYAADLIAATIRKGRISTTMA